MYQSDGSKSNHSLQDRHFRPKDIVEKIPNDESHNKIQGSEMTNTLLSGNPEKAQSVQVHDGYSENNTRQVHGTYVFLFKGFAFDTDKS
jgi:adenine-specific DNA methylase